MASSLSSLNICRPFSTTQNYQSCFINRPSTSIAPCKAKPQEGRQQVLRARTIPQPAPVVVFSRFPEARTIQQMMNTMNRLMSTPTAACATWGPVWPKGRSGYTSGRTPWAIREKENEYKIRFDMPGMTRNDVKIWVDQGNMLVIQAEKVPNEGDNQDGWWPAKSFGRYHTQLALPEHVDFKNVKAEVKDGVLYITIPKASSTNRVDINVQ